MGTTVAIGGQLMAAYLNNTPIEDALLLTPWGTDPERGLQQITALELEKQYLKTIRILNMFRVTIDFSTLKATVYLRTIEPETVVTIHAIHFGIPSTADGSRMTTSVVGNNIILNDKNCIVSHVADAVCLTFDLMKHDFGTQLFLDNSRKYYGQNTNAIKPEYISLEITVDLHGDKSMVLPDTGKKVFVERYHNSHEKLQVR